MKKNRRNNLTLENQPDVFKQRLQYVCEVLFGGKHTKFAEAAGYAGKLTWFGKAVYRDAIITASMLAQIIQTGLVNADYLMCGTGPACDPPRDDAPGKFSLAPKLQTEFACFDTARVQFTAHIERTAPNIDVTDDGSLTLARAIHAARAADKPVMLYVTEQAMLEGISAIIAQMLRKRYVTLLVCTTGAAYRDVEYARYGGFAKTTFDNQLIDINEAAFLAAEVGIGYGEAIGRWCFSSRKSRKDSAIATAYELGTPVVIQTTVGDSFNHWFPSKRGAELGAALGAASYADMLVFAEQLRQCVGAECGVFIPTAQNGLDFLELASCALESDAATPPINVMSYFDMMDISGKTKRTFPALLTSCDAVYDGSADNGKRPCRVRRN